MFNSAQTFVWRFLPSVYVISLQKRGQAVRECCIIVCDCYRTGPYLRVHDIYARERVNRCFQLYHEAACVGLLETVLFHQDGAQCISEVTIDLLNYALEQLTALLALLK